jgi:hypothetical protein
VNQDHIIVGSGQEADYFVCLLTPRFVAEFVRAKQEFQIEPAPEVLAGADQKHGSARCRVTVWIDDPYRLNPPPDMDLADAIARHVRVAFDVALTLLGESDA